MFAISNGGNGVWGITSDITAAGVIGENSTGEAVVGKSNGGNGIGAVVGRNNSSGYGVRGFNTDNGIGVLGQAGNNGGTGTAGRFENLNASNPTDALVVAGNGTGDLIQASQAGNTRFRVQNNGNVTADGAFTGGVPTSRSSSMSRCRSRLVTSSRSIRRRLVAFGSVSALRTRASQGSSPRALAC